MINHWMDLHPVNTSPPEFRFSIISQHRDALSRQIKEAVCIRADGTLNKRNEYALNELIQMESSKYPWDQAECEIINKKHEAARDIKLKNFVSVMSNVIKLDDKSDHVMSNVGDIHYRLKQTKKKADTDK